MSQYATDLAVRKTITVEAPRERAFEVFAERMGEWWPHNEKTINDAEFETAVVEPRAGGRWYERGVDGSECDWGRVVAFEPPKRLILNWQLGTEWTYDPSLETVVEVRFIADGDARTRVELEHRGLEAYAEQAQRMQTLFDSPDGWQSILEAYREAASAA